MHDFFPSDYFSARTAFCEAAARLGARLQRIEITARGPEQQPLSMDIAFLGPDDADRAVVISCGLHGVEAFFGSAVQQAWMNTQLSRTLPAGTAVVLVHALNPYGFAWVRRTDENNVDQNRNYLLAGEAYAGAPAGYQRLDRFLNPKQRPSWFDPFRIGAVALILRHGLKPLKEAVAVGQYEYPQGLFFGGKAPAESTAIVQREFRNWIGGARAVTHIDLHSGLGKFATHRLLTVEPPGSKALADLQRRFGDKVESVSSGVAYPARGLMATWLTQALADVNYTSISPEFGTYPVTHVLAALRAENQAHFFAQPNEACHVRAKKRLLEALCPASPVWRAKVLADGCDIINRAIAAAG